MIAVRAPGLADVDAWARSSGVAPEQALAELGIDDGLPVAPVARAAVEQALAAARLAPGDVVATLPPLLKPATAEALAVCSLLAGCEPAHLPVVAAAIKGVAAPEFNGIGVLTTTGSAAIATIVNGPVASAFNGGANLLGPGNRANASVGRAIALATQAIGGSSPGLTDMATMGQPGKYTFCFAEDEANSPWEPLHVARGVPAGTSAVTVFGAAGTVEVANPHAASADAILDSLAAAMFLPGSLDFDRHVVAGGRCVLILSLDWARVLAGEGHDRSTVCRELATRAAWSVSSLPPGLSRALGTSADGDAVIKAVEDPSDILLVVGGGTGAKQALIPAWPAPTIPQTVVV